MREEQQVNAINQNEPTVMEAVAPTSVKKADRKALRCGVAPFAGQGRLAFAIATDIARRIGWSGNGTKPKCR